MCSMLNLHSMQRFINLCSCSEWTQSATVRGVPVNHHGLYWSGHRGLFTAGCHGSVEALTSLLLSLQALVQLHILHSQGLLPLTVQLPSLILPFPIIRCTPPPLLLPALGVPTGPATTPAFDVPALWPPLRSYLPLGPLIRPLLCGPCLL